MRYLMLAVVSTTMTVPAELDTVCGRLYEVMGKPRAVLEECMQYAT